MEVAPSASYSLTIRVEIKNVPGMLGKLASAIGQVGGDIGAVDIVSVNKSTIIRDITVRARDENHGHEIVNAIKEVMDVKVIHVSDRTFLMHLGGKIEIRNKIPVKTRDDLTMVYTPGVARVCMAIRDDPGKAFNLTIKKNTVAIVTDGSAVLGLGDIGPEAALPVMEGKAMLFKEFGGIDAFPICLSTRDTDEIIRTIKYISPAFGAINLEDISSPRCFEIEERLKKEINIPVFHDDQHGTAVVVLAAMINALKVVKKKIEEIKVIVVGIGAAGVACTKMMMTAGVKNIIGLDRTGTIYLGRKENMNPVKEWYAANTNPSMVKGGIIEAAEGADLILGLSGPGVIPVDALKKMNKDPIVFAMANPVPEIMPEEAEPYVRIMATGRSDYSNQINNVLCFPGLFRGVLDSHAFEINDDMKLAAAYAIASVVTRGELHEDYIIPSVFNKKVVRSVANEVAKAAYKTGAARRRRRLFEIKI
ncbi:MAG: malic enzyme-like NAD(P)-binding protein [Nitrospirota bacterium]